MEVRKMLYKNERVSNFVAKMFETAEDGVIEWYEFLDFLIVLQPLTRPLMRADVESAMNLARKDGVERPWSFDEDGVCSMPGLLDDIKTVFKLLDTNRDGTLDSFELYGFKDVPDVTRQIK